MPSIKKPFYFNPPWNILFELQKLQKVWPWDVNISFLLVSFLKEMEKRGEIDFRASGIALDSSSTIYLMKSKLLLKLQEPPLPPRPPPDFAPPPLPLPLRYELTSTTIQHLLNVLDEVLQGEKIFTLKPHPEPFLPPPEIVPPVDIYMMEIEKQIENLYIFLKQLAYNGKLVVFSEVIAGLKKLDAIKTFIVLLFLAQRGEVSLWQNEDSDDIYITVARSLSVEERRNEIS